MGARHQTRIEDGQIGEAHLQDEKSLMFTLTQQQKETFEEFKGCQSEICDITARQAFTDGFILATRIMVEVMDGMEAAEEI